MPQTKRLQNLRLGEVIDIRDGTHDTPQYVEQGIPLITSKNLADSGLCFRDVNYISEDNHREISKRSGVERGDILYGMIGTIGKPTLVDTDRKFSIKNVALFKQSNPEISNRYLRWLLKSPSINKQIAQASKGGTQKFVSLSVLRGLEATFPPLPEQIRIAAILDKADALRTKRRESLAQLDSLTQSIFIEMFGDPLKNPRQWKTRPLLEICDEINDCPHSTPLWTDEGEICLRTSNLTEGGWNWDDTRYVSEATYHERSKRGYVASGDIVLSREGTVGIAAIVNPGMKICMGQRLVQVRPSQSALVPEFLLRHLLYILSPMRIGQMMVGSTSQHLNVKELKTLRIPLPPIDLQRKFARHVGALEKLKNFQTVSLAELDTLFSSLQHRAFRGEL